jgi:hypothetical protein
MGQIRHCGNDKRRHRVRWRRRSFHDLAVVRSVLQRGHLRLPQGLIGRVLLPNPRTVIHLGSKVGLGFGACKTQGTNRSGDRLRKAANRLQRRMWAFCVPALSLRAFISSIIRWRSGLTTSLRIGRTPVLDEVDYASILKTGRTVRLEYFYCWSPQPRAPARSAGYRAAI